LLNQNFGVRSAYDGLDFVSVFIDLDFSPNVYYNKNVQMVCSCFNIIVALHNDYFFMEPYLHKNMHSITV